MGTNITWAILMDRNYDSQGSISKLWITRKHMSKVPSNFHVFMAVNPAETSILKIDLVSFGPEFDLGCVLGVPLFYIYSLAQNK